LIDRSDASWSNVKQVLATLQGCKLELSSILVIRPGGLHRIISEATVRFLDLGFAEGTNVKFLKNVEQALAHIEPKFISTVCYLSTKIDNISDLRIWAEKTNAQLNSSSRFRSDFATCA